MIVLTAPTSQIGHQVLDRLVAAGAPTRVVVRDPSRLPDDARGRVEVVTGSHADADTVRKAFVAAETVFWLVPPDPRAASVEAAYASFARPALAALEEQGVPRVVGVSALGRGTPQARNAGLVTGSLAMDDLIAGLDSVSYRALTMPSFIDNIARQLVPIRDEGVFSAPISGARRLPACATRDIAAVAAELLLDSSWTGDAEVPVLGPEDLSFDDMAQVMTAVLGRPVQYQQVTPESYQDRMMQLGMSEAMAQAMLDMALAKEAGLDDGVARTPETSSPTTFRQWCEDTLRPAVEGGGQR